MIKIHSDTNDTYRFTLEAESGDTLLTSISFSEETKMKEVIKRLVNKPLSRNHFERQTSTDGKFLFSLNDDSGQTIGHGEPYDSEAGLENGIKNLRNRIKAFL